LTGDLVWDSIGTFLNIGGLNLFTSANLTNMSMVGTDANLASLLSAGEAEIIVSFQQITTSPQQTEGCDELIGQIRCGGISTGSYSGTLTADVANVPEPGTYVMLGAGLVGLAMLRRRAVK
jgi:hypothetical protein